MLYFAVVSSILINLVSIEKYFCFISAQINDNKSFSCKPNEHFDKDCRECTCSATGKSATCSGFICDPVNKSIQMEPPKTCKNGEKWSDGCNDCYCGSM